MAMSETDRIEVLTIELAKARDELDDMRRYVAKMDGIMESVITWGNQCNESAHHYANVCRVLMERGAGEAGVAQGA